MCSDYILRYTTLLYLILDTGLWWRSDTQIDVLASTDEWIYRAGICKYISIISGSARVSHFCIEV